MERSPPSYVGLSKHSCLGGTLVLLKDSGLVIGTHLHCIKTGDGGDM